jgi:hypothetical protein
MFQRRLYNLLQYSPLSNYTAHSTSHQLPTIYIILKYISPNTGQVLSNNTWEKH